MKSLKNKVKTVFRDNVWLSVVAVILLFFLVVAEWKFSLHIARIFQSNNAINTLAERDAVISDITETPSRLYLDGTYIEM